MCFSGAIICFQICAVGSHLTQIKIFYSWGPCGVILSHWFWKQGLQSWPPLKLSNLGEQRQKRLGFYLVYFLACPISCLFLHAREVPGPRESQNIVCTLWLSLHRWAINFHLSFCLVFCRVLLRHRGELCS